MGAGVVGLGVEEVVLEVGWEEVGWEDCQASLGLEREEQMHPWFGDVSKEKRCGHDAVMVVWLMWLMVDVVSWYYGDGGNTNSDQMSDRKRGPLSGDE